MGRAGKSEQRERGRESACRAQDLALCKVLSRGRALLSEAALDAEDCSDGSSGREGSSMLGSWGRVWVGGYVSQRWPFYVPLQEARAVFHLLQPAPWELTAEVLLGPGLTPHSQQLPLGLP